MINGKKSRLARKGETFSACERLTRIILVKKRSPQNTTSATAKPRSPERERVSRRTRKKRIETRPQNTKGSMTLRAKRSNPPNREIAAPSERSRNDKRESPSANAIGVRATKYAASQLGWPRV